MLPKVVRVLRVYPRAETDSKATGSDEAIFGLIYFKKAEQRAINGV